MKTFNDNTIRNQSAANFGGGKLCLYYYSHAVVREKKIIGETIHINSTTSSINKHVSLNNYSKSRDGIQYPIFFIRKDRL
jgi:hypothetical protein